MKTFYELIELLETVAGYTSVRLGLFRSKKRLKESIDHEAYKKKMEHYNKAKADAEEETKTSHSLEKHYNYDEEHHHTIKQYTGGGGSSYDTVNGSEPMNKALHKNKGKIEGTKHHNLMTRMDKVVKKNKAPHDFHVYTGLHKSHEINKIKTSHNDTIKLHHHGFTSTSLHKGIAVSFAQSHETKNHHVLKIHVPKGHHGAYVGHHSGWNDEKEFVLPRGTKLHVHPKPTIEHSNPDYPESSKYHVWHAKIVKE